MKHKHYTVYMYMHIRVNLDTKQSLQSILINIHINGDNKQSININTIS